jgi:hypothetical protein
MFRSVRAALLISALVITAVAASAAAAPATPTTVHDHDAAPGKLSTPDFRADMRALWEDHIVWTRQYIVSAATLGDDLPDIGPTAARLFANQDDIGAAIAPFYGDAAGSALTALLTDHIAIAADAIATAKAGDAAGLDAALAAWYGNADDIAAFLADANPTNWPFEAMSAHMRDHLDHTLDEAVARLNGDYEADIAAYDAVHEQILHMADMLSDGIIAQFPQLFTGS